MVSLPLKLINKYKFKYAFGMRNFGATPNYTTLHTTRPCVELWLVKVTPPPITTHP